MYRTGAALHSRQTSTNKLLEAGKATMQLSLELMTGTSRVEQQALLCIGRSSALCVGLLFVGSGE